MSTLKRDGLAALVDAILARIDDPDRARPAAEASDPRRRLAEDAAALAAAFVRNDADPRLAAIVATVAQGTMTHRDGALAAIRLLAAPGEPA